MKVERAFEVLSREPKPTLKPFFAARTQRRLPAGRAAGILPILIILATAAVLPFWSEVLTRFLFFATPVAFGIWTAGLRIRFGSPRD